MKAAFALLANADVHNVVRRLAWEMHLGYHTGTRHCSLPPHVSLKQPFRVTDLAALEDYMAELAGSIEPFEISLTELQVDGMVLERTEYGILWVNVHETEYLRGLHDRVNRELSQRFGETQANFDGPEYRFHLTVTLGGQPIDVYRRFLREIADPAIDLRFTARELAMFVYDEPMGPNGEYLSYKVLPIGSLALAE
jgi:2'-5' RNA ligase